MPKRVGKKVDMFASPELLEEKKKRKKRRYSNQQESDSGPTGPAADITGDGIVDGADLTALLGNWNGSGIGDFNGDGIVDGADLTFLLGQWGQGTKKGLAAAKQTPDFLAPTGPLSPIDVNTVKARNKARRVGRKAQKYSRPTGFSSNPGGGVGGSSNTSP